MWERRGQNAQATVCDNPPPPQRLATICNFPLTPPGTPGKIITSNCVQINAIKQLTTSQLAKIGKK